MLSVEGLSLKHPGLSAVASVQGDYRRVTPKGASPSPNQSFVEPSISFCEGSQSQDCHRPKDQNRLQWDFGHSNKRKKQGEEKTFIYEKLEKKPLCK